MTRTSWMTWPSRVNAPLLEGLLSHGFCFSSVDVYCRSYHTECWIEKSNLRIRNIGAKPPCSNSLDEILFLVSSFLMNGNSLMTVCTFARRIFFIEKKCLLSSDAMMTGRLCRIRCLLVYVSIPWTTPVAVAFPTLSDAAYIRNDLSTSTTVPIVVPLWYHIALVTLNTIVG